MPEAVETGERRVTVDELDSGENIVIVRQWERKRCYNVGGVSERLESVFLVSKGVRAIGQGNTREKDCGGWRMSGHSLGVGNKIKTKKRESAGNRKPRRVWDPIFLTPPLET